MTASYVWLITDDELAAPGDRADRSTAGPARVSEGLEKAIRSDDLPLGFTRAVFRMYDDDGGLYYRGRMFYAETRRHRRTSLCSTCRLWATQRRLHTNCMERRRPLRDLLDS